MSASVMRAARPSIFDLRQPIGKVMGVRKRLSKSNALWVNFQK